MSFKERFIILCPYWRLHYMEIFRSKGATGDVCSKTAFSILNCNVYKRVQPQTNEYFSSNTSNCTRRWHTRREDSTKHRKHMAACGVAANHWWTVKVREHVCVCVCVCVCLYVCRVHREGGGYSSEVENIPTTTSKVSTFPNSTGKYYSFSPFKNLPKAFTHEPVPPSSHYFLATPKGDSLSLHYRETEDTQSQKA